MSDQEKRNNNIGLITSVVVHFVLFLAFLFLMAWRAPNPPLPEYGIELNFGLDTQGSGDVQPETPPSEEPTDEVVEEKQAESQLTEEAKETETEEQQQVVPSNQESVVPVKEEKPKEAAEKPKEEDKPKEEVAREKVADKTEEKKTGDPVPSQGDDKNKGGDKGDPKGTLDAKALYGKQGGGAGGTGMDLQMAGWAWADPPEIPELPDNEDGRIVFEIECDSEGEIIGINVLERGLSARAEQLLKEEIRKNSLIRTSAGQTPERSKGKVVFVLKTR